MSTKAFLKKLCLSSLMIALAAVLSAVHLIKMPLGGSVTLLSMLPICMLSLLYGVRSGLLSAFAYALIQLIFGLPAAMGWGMTPVMWTGAILFDYLIAFTVLGFSGLFRHHGRSGKLIGIALAMVLRFLSHLVSGAIFFAAWTPEGFANPFLYSFVYNGSFMLPELILTLIAAALLIRLPIWSKFA